ncbi:MAG: DMT family transporter [Cyanobacteria bacterium SIG31]|nr:DMT family transporter [Cyanobacteria bacterium SIG31]
MKNRLAGNIALFLTALIWGLGFVAQRAGMEFIGPFTFNAVRSFLGALSLVPLILWVKYSKVDTRTPIRKYVQRVGLAKAGISCGIALFIAMSIQQYCMQFVGAGKAGFITALYIIFVPIFSVFMGSKIAKRVIFSVFLSVIGLYLLCFHPDGGYSIYDLWLLIGALFYGAHILVVDNYSRVHPIKASCVQFLVVGILSLIPMFLLENPTLNSLIECKIPLLYAGFLACGVAYTLQMFGQKHTFPILASLILCLESVFAVIGGALILGEILNAREIIGCILMISGFIIANTKVEQRF